MLKLIRASIWWHTIIPQILGWIYYCVLLQPSADMVSFRNRLFFFLAGVLAIAVFGYLWNDYCDVTSDRLAGKVNLLGRLALWTRSVVVLIPLVAGVTCWTLADSGTVANLLYALQIIALVIYSAPPFRFKERGMWGVAADAFYAHVNPAFFTIATFCSGHEQAPWYALAWYTCLLVVTGLKGTRNILLHQLGDRKRDRAAAVRTFVVQHGAASSLRLINLLLPFEVLFTLVLVLLLSFQIPPFFFSFFLFLAFTYFTFSGWKLPYLPRRQRQFKFLYFMNDYYEGWMPVSFLLVMSVRQPACLFLLLLHLLLFPSFLIKIWYGINTIIENFKTEEDY